MSREVDAGDGQRAAPVQGFQGRRYQRAHRGEEDGGVERLGRRVVRITGAGRTQLQGQGPGFGAPGHDVDPGPFGHGDLGGEVGRAAEPVDPQSTAGREAGPSEGPVADDAGAEQGGRLLVAERVGQRVDVGLLDHDVLGVAPVEVPAREQRREAQILAGRPCRSGTSRTSRQPRDPDPVPAAEAAAVRRPAGPPRPPPRGPGTTRSRFAGRDPLRPDGDRSGRRRTPGRAGGPGPAPAPGHPGRIRTSGPASMGPGSRTAHASIWLSVWSSGTGGSLFDPARSGPHRPWWSTRRVAAR